VAALIIGVTASILNMAHIAQSESLYGIGRIVFVVLLCLISWIIFHSKQKDIVKATFMTVPLMVLLIMIGIGLYGQPIWMIGGISVVIIGATFGYIYINKLSWMYFFATIYVTLLALAILIFQIQI
jgi:hypothetical protein